MARKSKYFNIIETLEDGYFEVDLSGNFISFNRSFQHMLGYSKDKLKGMNYRKCTNSVSARRLYKTFNQIYRTGTSEKLVREELIKKDNTSVHVELSVSLLKDSDDKHSGFCGIARDITEKMRTEDFYRMFSEKSLVCVYITCKGRFRFVNENGAKYVGCSIEDLIGTESILIVHPDDREFVMQCGRDMFKGKRTTPYEYRIISTDGKLRWITETVAPISYEGELAVLGNSSDITVLKQSELALRESENLYRAMFENTGTASIIINDEDKIIKANTGAANITGYTTEELEGKLNWAEFVVPEDIVKMKQYQKLRKENPDAAPNTYEFRMIDKNRAIKHCFNTVGIIPGTNKRIASILDITPRKIAEEALHKSEQLYRSVIENIIDVFYRSDINGNLFMISPSGAKMLGYESPEKMKGVNIAKTHHTNPEEGKRLLKALKTEGLVIDFPFTLKRLNGDLVYVETNSRIYYDDHGNISWVEGTFRDVTDRKRMEEALITSELRYKSLFDYAADGILIMEGDIFVDCNASALKMFGCTREQIVGKSPYSFSPPVQPDGSNSQEESLKRIKMALQGQPQFFEWKHRTLDGTLFDAEVSLNIIEIGHDVILQSLVRDITDRKVAEAELHKLNEELEQRVLERTLELETAFKELETFSYTVSHDLRTPLRAIDGYMGILKETYLQHLPQDALRYIGLVRTNAQKMGKLLDDLLNFLRVSRQTLSRQTIFPEAIVRRALAELASQYKILEESISIKPMPQCIADPILLRAIFIHLLSNAFKFSAKVEKPLIEIGCNRKGGEPSIYFVRDNGVGFEMRYVHKIFGVFQRLHKENDYPGTGVGLAIVQHIVHRHGGLIWAESVVGKGATFYFTLESSRSCPKDEKDR